VQPSRELLLSAPAREDVELADMVASDEFLAVCVSAVRRFVYWIALTGVREIRNSDKS
jgi:hypothetical protein